MSYCSLNSITKHFFANASNMIVLDISYNKLQIIEADTFSYLKHLRQIVMEGNQFLKRIDPFAFQGLNDIRELRITGTRLKTLRANTFSSLRLDYLDLSNNTLETVEGLAFNNALIKEINLLPNNIRYFDSNMFEGVVGLTLLQTTAYKFCCIRPADLDEDNCYPHKDEFSSCKDLMRNGVLQVLLWVIGLMAFIGNILSLVYRLMVDRRRLTLGYGIFVTNLAVSDLLMGLYLIIIAIADVALRNR